MKTHPMQTMTGEWVNAYLKEEVEQRLSEVEAERDNLVANRKRLIEENFHLTADQERMREALEGWERKARVTLWARHGCPSQHKYGDDGELQCSNVAAHPGIVDFKRTPFDEIEAALMTATLAALSTPRQPQDYQCERCGGTGQQGAGLWTGNAYASKAGTCDFCAGTGRLGAVPRQEPT